MMNRLAKRFGVVFNGGEMIQYAFPRPEDLKNASEAEIKDLGYSTGKARAIRELAQTFCERPADPVYLAKISNGQIVQYLTTLRGIGRWSAEYALLRGLGRLDIFPGDDVGARNNLTRLFHLAQKPDYEKIDQLTSRWRLYRGMIYFHLLLDTLRRKGML
jgi:DNA-3-methyladenine glycosylase II